jgi:hypothetical protein
MSGAPLGRRHFPGAMTRRRARTDFTDRLDRQTLKLLEGRLRTLQPHYDEYLELRRQAGQLRRRLGEPSNAQRVVDLLEQNPTGLSRTQIAADLGIPNLGGTLRDLVASERALHRRGMYFPPDQPWQPRASTNGELTLP